MITVTPVDEPPIFTVTGSIAGFHDGGKFSFSVPFAEGDAHSRLRWRPIMATDAEQGNKPMLPRLPLGSGAPTVASSNSFLMTGILTFKTGPGFAGPNFEKPADADKDNVYEVTITATDENANMATMDVKVMVTNAEELGKVTLSQPQPRVGLGVNRELHRSRQRVGRRHLAVVEDRRFQRFGHRHLPVQRKMKMPDGFTFDPAVVLPELTGGWLHDSQMRLRPPTRRFLIMVMQMMI